MTEIPKVLTDELRAQLNTISTATLAHQLQMRGIRGSFFSGLKPTHPEMRMVGRARTLRYVALREDQAQRFQRGVNAQKRAAEGIEPGDVLIIEARNIPDAGTASKGKHISGLIKKYNAGDCPIACKDVLHKLARSS